MNILIDRQKSLNEDGLSVIKQVKEYLHIDAIIEETTMEEAIKALCVVKLCKAIGLNCPYNNKATFFEIFSSIVGQAIVDNLKIQLTIAPIELRCVRYNGINFITQASEYLFAFELDIAFIKIFEMLQHHKDVIKNLEWFKRKSY